MAKPGLPPYSSNSWSSCCRFLIWSLFFTLLPWLSSSDTESQYSLLKKLPYFLIVSNFFIGCVTLSKENPHISSICRFMHLFIKYLHLLSTSIYKLKMKENKIQIEAMKYFSCYCGSFLTFSGGFTELWTSLNSSSRAFMISLEPNFLGLPVRIFLLPLYPNITM